MAIVDFSNAVIEPFSGSPFLSASISLGSGTYVTDINNQSIADNQSRTVKRSATNELIIQYSGTLTASGTAMYISNNFNPPIHWRISNISFASGDTFNFQIVANMVNA